MTFFSAIKKRMLEMTCESDGKMSLSRVSPAIALVSVVIWVSYLVIKTHTLPDLTGPAFFTGAGAAHYGIGKFFGQKQTDADAVAAAAASPDAKH
jgi:hypothetical protein